MRHYFIYLILFFYVGNAFGQQNEIIVMMNAKAKTIDYFSHPNKYLDKNLKISITNNEFQNTIIKYNFFSDRIKKYNDSLNVVLMAEFNDWDHARFAIMRLTYS